MPTAAPYEELGIESPLRLMFTSGRRDAFRSGELQRVWRQEYDDIFDDEDLRIALTQPNNHFCEWFVAIYIYLTTGFPSLVEKYEFHGTHLRKAKIARDLLPAQIWEWERAAQLPDLLCYARERDQYFFCEVKGPGDSLRVTQEALFNQLEEVTERQILIAHLTVGERDSIIDLGSCIYYGSFLPPLLTEPIVQSRSDQPSRPRCQRLPLDSSHQLTTWAAQKPVSPARCQARDPS